MNKIPFYIVTGFLGSGKTTLLKNLIEHTGAKRIGIIQNEFAPANIDGGILKNSTTQDFDLLEINNGSVFCVCLLNGFIKSLNSFIDKVQPDIIILEASGLADPISLHELLIDQSLSEKIFLTKTICIVDGSNFLKLSVVLKRVEHQIRIADTIILNKIELAGDNDKKIIDKLRVWNPLATLIKSNYCKTNYNDLLKSVATPNGLTGIKQNSDYNRPSEINAAVIKTQNKLLSSKVEEFLKSIRPQSVRIKGNITLDNNTVISVQSTYDDQSWDPIENPNSSITELVTMGTLSAIELNKIYKKYCVS